MLRRGLSRGAAGGDDAWAKDHGDKAGDNKKFVHGIVPFDCSCVKVNEPERRNSGAVQAVLTVGWRHVNAIMGAAAVAEK